MPATPTPVAAPQPAPVAAPGLAAPATTVAAQTASAASGTGRTPYTPTPAEYDIAQRIAFAPMMFQAARCARDMGLLEALDTAAGPLTPQEVADRSKVSLYAARVLLEACLAMKLVSYDDSAHTYAINGAGQVMLRDPMTRVNMNFTHDVCYQGAFYLRESLEQGKPVGLHETFGDWPTVYAGLTQTPEAFQKSWFGFDHFYSDPVFRHALKLLGERGVQKVLDVGGNTGRFSVQAAKSMHVTVLDHPKQLELARQNAVAAGVAERFSTQPIDLLDHGAAFPLPFDAVWMSQLLDCFGEADIVQLLKRAKAALGPKGRVYVLETYWDRQPHDLAAYSVQATSLYFTCIANGQSRMYHSADMLRCAREAGLTVEVDQRLGAWHTLLVLQPA